MTNPTACERKALLIARHQLVGIRVRINDQLRGNLKTFGLVIEASTCRVSPLALSGRPSSSIRMRRTSRTVSGLDWHEWPWCSITTSDSTPSMWALLYSTTPSLRVCSGPSCSVGMME